MPGSSLEERFLAHVDIRGQNECWPWLPIPAGESYGGLTLPNGSTLGAHRFAWIRANGLIPDGLWVLHSCDYKPCCNERHLFLGTDLDNIADKVAKGRQRGARLGEEHHFAKLAEAEVRQIRARLDSETGRALAKEFGVSPSTISLIGLKRIWPHV